MLTVERRFVTKHRSMLDYKGGGDSARNRGVEKLEGEGFGRTWGESDERRRGKEVGT